MKWSTLKRSARIVTCNFAAMSFIHLKLFASMIKLTLIAAYFSVESQKNLFSLVTAVANL